MSTGKTVGLILGTIALLGLLVVGSCSAVLFKGYKSNQAEVEPMVEELIASMEKGDMGPTFKRLSTKEMQATIDTDNVSSLGLNLHERLGKLESKSMTGMEMKMINGNAIRVVNYKATFENGDGVIKIEAQKEDGEWKLRYFNVNSPALHEKRATCSSCGKTHPVSAKFCPGCGEATAPQNPVPAPATP